MRLPFKTEPICFSACSFSSAVFETIQSDGAKILRSRMCASLAVNRTQMLPAGQDDATDAKRREQRIECCVEEP